MKRNAGSFLHQLKIEAVLLDRGIEGVFWGLTIGTLLYAMVIPLIGYGWGFVPFIAVLTGVLIAMKFAGTERFSQWNFENLQKGENAETRVGQLIEYALTRDGCAVAHSVTAGIARVGDIDHMVATPIAIWVIETKYRKVPRKELNKVLGRIAANTVAVRQWAPAGTTVRGCLVLAYETKISKRKYPGPSGKEEITAYTTQQLVREMSHEARSERSLEEKVARDIWELGQVSD